MKKLVITGGAGFIGSHVVRLFVNKYPDYQIYNLDALTYAGNLANNEDVASAPNYHFIKADITDAEHIDALFAEHQFDGVLFHLFFLFSFGDEFWNVYRVSFVIYCHKNDDAVRFFLKFFAFYISRKYIDGNMHTAFAGINNFGFHFYNVTNFDG